MPETAFAGTVQSKTVPGPIAFGKVGSEFIPGVPESGMIVWKPPTSVFFHSITEPAGTVTDWGEKLRPCIETTVLIGEVTDIVADLDPIEVPEAFIVAVLVVATDDVWIVNVAET